VTITQISTHVLDTVSGVPARDLEVELGLLAGDDVWHTLAVARTDDDGRIVQWAGTSPASRGTFRLVFAISDYFAERNTQTIYPRIEVCFEVADADHHHVPLLLGAYAYSTYRGR
jgi:5-hydroxyisourate hydrolase